MTKNKATRTKNTLFSTVSGFASYFITAILGFVVRSIFIQYLQIKYLGVNGLFSSILQIFSLAELGFATAVGFALYKPLSEKNEKKVSALMRYYAKFYTVIGFIVLALGLIILPFLQYLIKDFETVQFSINELRLYFGLFLLSSATSYFVAYKKTLLISDQKKYIVNLNMLIFTVLKCAVQIVMIIVFKSFVLYLIISVIFVYLENIVASVLTDKKYTYLKKNRNAVLLPEEKKELFSQIGALAIAKMSSVFTTGIISLIISVVVGFEEVGLYSNYFLVTSTVMAVVTVIFEALTASAGNFATTENKEKQRELFNRISYFFSFMSALIFVGLFTQFDRFIVLWLKKEVYLLPPAVAMVMALNTYIWCMRLTPWVAYNAYGLYKHYFYRSFFEIVVFGVLAYFGALYFGVAGVIAAQVIAVVTTQFWIEIYVVTKYALEIKQSFYYKKLIKYVILTLISLGASILLCGLIKLVGLWGFIVQVLIVCVIVAAVYVALTFRTAEFKYYKDLVFKTLKHYTFMLIKFCKGLINKIWKKNNIAKSVETENQERTAEHGIKEEKDL